MVIDLSPCVEVLPIWEGTSSINALDTVRAINKTRGAALAALVARVDKIAAEAGAELADTGAVVARAMHALAAAVEERGEQLQHLARDLTTSIAHTYIAALLIGEYTPMLSLTSQTTAATAEHAASTRAPGDLLVARRWAGSRPLVTLAPAPQYGEAAQCQVPPHI